MFGQYPFFRLMKIRKNKNSRGFTTSVNNYKNRKQQNQRKFTYHIQNTQIQQQQQQILQDIASLKGQSPKTIDLQQSLIEKKLPPSS